MPPEVHYGSSDKLPMSRAEVAFAKSVCYLCPVRQECLEYAILSEERWGVWGGMTAPERERLVHGRRQGR